MYTLEWVIQLLTTLPRIRLQLILHTCVDYTVYTKVFKNKLQTALVIILILTLNISDLKKKKNDFKK